MFAPSDSKLKKYLQVYKPLSHDMTVLLSMVCQIMNSALRDIALAYIAMDGLGHGLYT